MIDFTKYVLTLANLGIVTRCAKLFYKLHEGSGGKQQGATCGGCTG